MLIKAVIVTNEVTLLVPVKPGYELGVRIFGGANSYFSGATGFYVGNRIDHKENRVMSKIMDLFPVT